MALRNIMTKKKHNKIIKVSYIDQTKDWPTGCESVSAVMLLQYLGVDISVGQFVEQYLEKEPFFEKNGKLYGGNPWKVFVGDPADDQSMGCYAPVIKKALEKVFQEHIGAAVERRAAGWEDESLKDSEKEHWQCKKDSAAFPKAVDLTGVSMETLLRDYIDHDIPVIFWASIDLKETYAGPEWILTDSGETFLWRSNEHCMLLVGYDEENYYFNDPWQDHGTIGYERKLVEKRHEEQYSMAVTIV